jgi:hypothetical protein
LGTNTSKPNHLYTINKVIQDHEVIHATIKSVRNSNKNLAAAFNAAQKSGWTQEDTILIFNKLREVNERLTDLEEGFRLHYQQDEEALPPIVGDLI